MLGSFGKVVDEFTTKNGRKVSLEVYVEPGKEARALYSLTVLKLAMKFDEDFFDREYDLDSMKMVGIPDFNMGAMENKGLMIFNDTALLVDQHSVRYAGFGLLPIQLPTNTSTTGRETASRSATGSSLPSKRLLQIFEPFYSESGSSIPLSSAPKT